MRRVATLTGPCSSPAGGAVEECVTTACTTPPGHSVTAAPRGTSRTPAAGWTVLTHAYVSEDGRNGPRAPQPTKRLLCPPSGCSCSSDGTVDGGRCEDSPDSCRCKEKVEGPRCDRCKTGFYGLSASNPAGCSRESSSPC